MTSPRKRLDDLGSDLQRLLGAGVEFVVVGAHALAAHGLLRATDDLGYGSGARRGNAEGT